MNYQWLKKLGNEKEKFNETNLLLQNGLKAKGKDNL